MAVDADLFAWHLGGGHADSWVVTHHDYNLEGAAALRDLLNARRDELHELTTALRTEAANSAAADRDRILTERRRELAAQHLCALQELERDDTVTSLAHRRRERAEAVSESLAQLG